MEQSLRLSEAIDRFLSYKVDRLGSTRSTFVTYESILGRFLSYIGNKPIRLMSIHDIDRYAEYLSKQNYKSKTLANNLATIRSFIRYLYAKNLASIRPESVDIPRIVDSEANFLSPEEQERLLSVINIIRDKAIISLMIDSGLRVSEVNNLKYDDLYQKTIVVIFGKGKKHRVTFITDKTRALMDQYLATKRRTEYLFTGPVSCCYSKNQLSRQYIHRIVTEYAKRAQIEKKVTPHTLRHTFATNLMQNGARAEVVQPMMGHANIRTTLIYTHFTNPYLQGEYEKYR